MITPYGEYLLVQIIEKPKKKSLILMQEDEDPIVKCEILGEGCDTDLGIHHSCVLYFRRYELRDCVDKEKKIYLIKEEFLLGYEEKNEV